MLQQYRQYDSSNLTVTGRDEETFLALWTAAVGNVTHMSTRALPTKMTGIYARVRRVGDLTIGTSRVDGTTDRTSSDEKCRATCDACVLVRKKKKQSKTYR